MNSYKKLGKNISAIAIGGFSSKILAFLFIPFYTAALTTEEYGVADLISTTFVLLLPFFSLEIRSSLMRFSLDDNADHTKIFKSGAVIVIAGYLLLLCISPVILLIPAIKKFYLLILFYYLCYLLWSTLGYFVRGINKVAIFSTGGVIDTVVTILANILFLLVFKMGIAGFLLSYALGYLSSFMYMFFAAHIFKYCKGSLRPEKALIMEMLRYSVPIIPNSICWWISNSSDKYILAIIKTASLAGIYSVAYKIPSMITTIVSIFFSAWSISAVEDFGSEQSKKFFASVYDKYIIILIVLSSGIIWFNKIIASILFSNTFYTAWKYVPILVLGSVFYGAGSFYAVIFTSAKKTLPLFYSTVAGALVNIILNLIFIPSTGAYGAAVATLISYIVILIVRVIASHKVFDFRKKSIRNTVLVGLIFVQCLLYFTDIKNIFIINGAVFLTISSICLYSLVHTRREV